MNSITVIKIGGSTFGNHDTTIDDIVALQKEGARIVVVHGGGSTVTEWLKKQNVATQFVRGERVTDLPTLAVATAVLAGLANKEIVAAINAGGGRAVGISGADGLLIEARARNSEMGYVGDVVRVNTAVLDALLSAGFVPVVSPISLYSVDRPDDAAHIINVNGDPIAGELAHALKAARLVYLTDVAGVKDSEGNIIAKISGKESGDLITAGIIAGGMIPKVNACLRAAAGGSIARIIDGTRPHALAEEVRGRDGGTTIVKE